MTTERINRGNGEAIANGGKRFAWKAHCYKRAIYINEILIIN